jgi:4-amino-4-deoxy-L-arabinose transferase-like glycosyltransferase
MREATAGTKPDRQRSTGAAPGTASSARAWFVGLWGLLFAAKALLAACLPLFVDEAFYWQEGMHPGWAYSDLPALTAWLARLGVEAGGQHALALRAPFLLLAACVPWLVAAITRRIAGVEAGWRAGILALLLPLSGTLGMLALPDVAMTVAAMLCLHAGARLLQRVDAAAAAELALGLVMGGLSHYRFAAIVAVGAIALLASARGREVLRDRRVWLAIAAGALAWGPLLAWNLAHADAGLRFQLVDRHPWTFHADGVRFLLLQALLATPLLFAALAHAAWRHRRDADPRSRYLALSGALFVVVFFALGFFADVERVSFHWPLQGMLALLPLVPGVLAAWGPRWRRATLALLACGLALAFAGYAAIAVPAARARLAETRWYPSNFAGWDALAAAVRAELAAMPGGTRVVADDFKIGAELGFLLGDPDIAVLDHPLNHKHGRAPQLRLWGLQTPAAGARLQRPALLVLGATDVKFSDLPDRFRFACAAAGALPVPSAVDVDHGAQRFLLFPLRARTSGASDACIPPAVASISLPQAGATVRMPFTVEGWAVKDIAGVARVTVTLDGKPVAVAEAGIANAWVPRFWQGRSRDPGVAHAAFSARVDAPGVAPGRHWLGLVLEGGDGSRETWNGPSVVVAP